MEIHRGPVSMYKGEWQHVRGSSMVASVQYGNWYKHAFYYSLPIYEGTGTAKVSTIDTVTQFVTGTHLSDNRVEDYFRNHAKGSVSFFGSNFIKGTHQAQDGLRLSLRRISSQAGRKRGRKLPAPLQQRCAVSNGDLQLPCEAGQRQSLSGAVRAGFWSSIAG